MFISYPNSISQKEYAIALPEIELKLFHSPTRKPRGFNQIDVWLLTKLSTQVEIN